MGTSKLKALSGPACAFGVVILTAFIIVSAPSITSAAPADMLIDNIDFVDVEQRRIIRNGQILIDDGRIIYAGERQMPVPAALQILDGSGLVALPGFVNAHTHLWQHVAKALQVGGDQQSWSFISHQFLHYSTWQEMHDVTLAAAAEAALSGVTTTSDFASAYSEFTLDATTTAIREMGLDGVIMWWNPAVFLPPDIKKDQIRQLQARIQPLDLWMAQGHAFLFDLPVIYEGIRIADELNLGISEHTMETVQTQRDVYVMYSSYLTRYGDRLQPGDRARLATWVAQGPPSDVDRVRWMRRLARQILEDTKAAASLTPEEKAQLQRWAGKPYTISVAEILDFLGAFDLNKKYLSIHSVWLNPRDIETYAQKEVSVAHNPASNMRLSSGIAPIWDYAAKGVTVALGTDGAASNDGISVLNAMRSAWNLQKLELLDATTAAEQIDVWYILRAATIQAAAALGMEDETGSITPGKQADLVLMSKQTLGLSPVIDSAGNDNLVALVIYSATQHSIDTVISNGKLIVQDGALLPPFDERALAENLTAIANRVMERQANGKEWTMEVDLASLPSDQDWYRYRSVRDKDTLGLVITNSGPDARRVLLAMSGATEGGAVAPMLTKDTLARFPLDAPESYWSQEITLGAGETLTVEKASGGYDYVINTAEGRFQRTGQAEQLLILVFARTDD